MGAIHFLDPVLKTAPCGAGTRFRLGSNRIVLEPDVSKFEAEPKKCKVCAMMLQKDRDRRTKNTAREQARLLSTAAKFLETPWGELTNTHRRLEADGFVLVCNRSGAAAAGWHWKLNRKRESAGCVGFGWVRSSNVEVCRRLAYQLLV
jgi:hypothetical protein